MIDSSLLGNNPNIKFEHNLWSKQFSEQLIILCKLLLKSNSNSIIINNNNTLNYLLILLIIEEYEDISSTLYITGHSLSRGWIIFDVLLKINSETNININNQNILIIDYELIIEKYMELFDLWIGKLPEKLLQVLSSASIILSRWIQSAYE